MQVRVQLPDLYRARTGKNKKKIAWTYLKLHYPDHDPLPEQPFLESENVVLCVIDFERARQHSRELAEKRAAKSNKKR